MIVAWEFGCVGLYQCVGYLITWKE